MALNSILNQPFLYQTTQPSRGDASSQRGSPKSKTNLIRMVEKKEVVGKGGFGKVWRVEHKGSGKSYALK
jgi:serine/threonine protein kinase